MRQAVGVFAHDLDRVRAIGLEDAHRPGRPDSMLVQKHHDLPDHFLVGPGRGDLVGALRSDALDLPQPLRLGLDDIEYVLAECLDHSLGVDRTDSADHAGAEIFLDPVQ